MGAAPGAAHDSCSHERHEQHRDGVHCSCNTRSLTREQHEHHGIAISLVAISKSLAISIAISLAKRGCGWGQGVAPLDGWSIGGSDRGTLCCLESWRICTDRQKR